MADADFLSKPAADAKAKGLKTFTIDQPCKNGHISPRYVSSRCCVACLMEKKARRRATDSEYRKSADRSYRERVKAGLPLVNTSDGKEYPHLSSVEYRRSVNARWKANNRQTHLIRHASNCAKRRAKKSLATPMWADFDAIEQVYRDAKTLEGLTGVPHHVDHIIPIHGKNVSGLHVHWNLRPIPATENLRKGNRLVEVDANFCIIG